MNRKKVFQHFKLTFLAIVPIKHARFFKCQMLNVNFKLSFPRQFKMSGGFLALQQKKSKERKKLTDLEDAFKEADKNKDGKLSLEEWCDVLAKAGHDNPRSGKKIMYKRTILLYPISCAKSFSAM